MKYDDELIQAAIHGLELERRRIDIRILALKEALHPTAAPAHSDNVTQMPKRKYFSAATRRRMSLAQKKRYAAMRRQA